MSIRTGLRRPVIAIAVLTGRRTPGHAPRRDVVLDAFAVTRGLWAAAALASPSAGTGHWHCSRPFCRAAGRVVLIAAVVDGGLLRRRSGADDDAGTDFGPPPSAEARVDDLAGGAGLQPVVRERNIGACRRFGYPVHRGGPVLAMCWFVGAKCWIGCAERLSMDSVSRGDRA